MYTTVIINLNKQLHYVVYFYRKQSQLFFLNILN